MGQIMLGDEEHSSLVSEFTPHIFMSLMHSFSYLLFIWIMQNA